jgi:hypothetical protein
LYFSRRGNANFVDVRDVAAAVSKLLVTIENKNSGIIKHENKVYVITDPRSIIL